MHYKVYFLDGYEITGVENVELNHEREIKIHKGLGQGNFPVPDDKELKTWTIKCEQDSDTSLFKTLEKLLDTQKESRLIISSEIDNISEMVLLGGYTKVEQDMGIYDVTIKFTEYKTMSMRTTDVPYIARGGKMPTLPKTVVMNGHKNTPYKVKQKAGKSNFEMASSVANGNRWQALQEAEYADAKTGKPYTNPCTIPDNFVARSLSEAESMIIEPMMKPIVKGVTAFWDWSTKANKEWREKIFKKIGQN